MRVAEGVSKYLPTKHGMKLRKCQHLCCVLNGMGAMKGGAGVQFLQKSKLQSEMFNNKKS